MRQYSDEQTDRRTNEQKNTGKTFFPSERGYNYLKRYETK